MLSPRTQIWIHRIGYVTTPVVVVLLLGLLALIGTNLRHEWKMRQQSLDQPRPLALDEEYEEASRYLLAQLPAVSAIRPDGVRMLITPSLTGRSYALALTRLNDRADARGTLIITTALRAPAEQQRIDFAIPAMEYAQTMNAFDREVAEFKGTPALLLDGVGVAFERVRGDSVVSGNGNDAYRNRLAALLYQLLRRHVTAPPLPETADWQLSRTSDCKARIAARASLDGCPLPDAIWKALAAQPQP